MAARSTASAYDARGTAPGPVGRASYKSGVERHRSISQQFDDETKDRAAVAGWVNGDVGLDRHLLADRALAYRDAGAEHAADRGLLKANEVLERDLGSLEPYRRRPRGALPTVHERMAQRWREASVAEAHEHNAQHRPCPECSGPGPVRPFHFSVWTEVVRGQWVAGQACSQRCVDRVVDRVVRKIHAERKALQMAPLFAGEVMRKANCDGVWAADCCPLLRNGWRLVI